MDLLQRQSSDIKETIRFCWQHDPEIKGFSRNSNDDLDVRVQKEVDCLNVENLKFFKISDGLNFVGYYGTEGKTLSTFFIMPEYRKEKDLVWKFITSRFEKEFYAGLFNVNTRARKFFLKQGGVKIADTVTENKPAMVFKFEVK